MNTQPVRTPLDHDISVDECECYAGYDYWRPADRSVEIAVCKLIRAHSADFQTFLQNAEADRREQAREDARDDERMRDPAEVAAAREFNRECRENR